MNCLYFLFSKFYFPIRYGPSRAISLLFLRGLEWEGGKGYSLEVEHSTAR